MVFSVLSRNRRQRCPFGITLRHAHGSTGTFSADCRPGIHEFLKDVSSFADIYAFTMGSSDYADAVFRFLDPYGTIFKGIWYGESSSEVRWLDFERETKDLQRAFGSDFIPERTVLVDDCVDNFVLQPLNGIRISEYFGRKRGRMPFDPELKRIQNLLRSLSETQDVRVELRKQWKKNDNFYDFITGKVTCERVLQNSN